MRGLMGVIVWIAVCGAAGPAGAAYDVQVKLHNTTEQDKTDWPVFLTVWKVFGGNLDLKTIDPEGFHVLDADGREIPHMVRPIPPDFSVGNDQIVFLVGKMAAGQTLSFRVTNTKTKGSRRWIDLADDPNNLLPNGGFERAGDGAPQGYEAPAETAVQVALDDRVQHSGARSLRLTLPVGSTIQLRSSRPVTFRKDGRYHFSCWARTDNVAYNGWGFWNDGATMGFEPAALRGRDSLSLRGTRDWYCYMFDAGGTDGWGVPEMYAVAQTETVRKGRETVPADIWSKAGGRAHLVIQARQADQPFLKGDKTGRVWIDEALLFEQPVVTVDRTAGLERVAKDGAIVFARPVQMPRYGVFPHEAADHLETFALRGQRVQLRFGIHAVRSLQDIEIEVLAPRGGWGVLQGTAWEIERLDETVEEYKPLARLNAGTAAEFLLSMPVWRDVDPGRYESVLTLQAGGKTLRELPVRVDVLPLFVPDMKPYLVGGIYNTGMGLARDEALYRCYAKTGFNYILLFDYLLRAEDGQIDYAAADTQIKQIVEIAKVTGGVGLYREPNMSEDQPRLWYQIASGKPQYEGPYTNGTDPRFEAGYKKLAREADAYARTHGWPRLVYMVSDEPGDKRDVDPSMGWLKEAVPGAVTIADVQFKDMLATWDWYGLPVFDDPIDWTGPMVYEWVRKQGRSFGFCGTGWPLAVARYQPGLMLASSGGIYWHFWHLKGPFEPKGGKVVRSHAVAAMAEGFNDLRYFVLLKGQKPPRRAVRGDPRETRAAAEFIGRVFAFATADHDRHLMPYNGVPEDWGYERFYDDWRARMKERLLQSRP